MRGEQVHAAPVHMWDIYTAIDFFFEFLSFLLIFVGRGFRLQNKEYKWYIFL